MTMPDSDHTAAVIAAAIGRAGQLATLPEIALNVMRLAEDPLATGEGLSVVLASDPTLSARVLRIVNSAYYGVRREVTSISHAVSLLGFGAVKSVALAASLTRMFRGGAIGNTFTARELWRHSVAVATGARMLAARGRNIDGSEAFLAGLMHDVGIIIEMQACRDGFVQVIAEVAADPALDFRDAEIAAIGANHEEFGRSLCRAWRFPETLQLVSGFHHRPLDLPGEHQPLVALVHIADHLAARGALGYGRMVNAGAIDEAVMTLASLTDADLEAVALVLPEEVEAVFAVLSGEEVAA